MPHSGADRHCATHPEQKAEGTCDYCGKDICGECIVEDVAAEKSYCSESCQAADSARKEPGLVKKRKLLDNAAHPLRNGWVLWARSLGVLTLHVTPVVMALALTLQWNKTVEDDSESAAAVMLSLFAFGIALTQVVLTQRYSGLVRGNPYVWTLRRFLPWSVTICIVIVVTTLGSIALVLPGIYLGVRLFWADEFALVHGAGPIRALKESWAITEGSAGEVFRFQFLAGLSMYVLIIAAAALFAGYGAILERIGVLPHVETVNSGLICLAIFVGYGALHGPELVYLYGMRAKRASSLTATTEPRNV